MQPNMSSTIMQLFGKKHLKFTKLLDNYLNANFHHLSKIKVQYKMDDTVVHETIISDYRMNHGQLHNTWNCKSILRSRFKDSQKSLRLSDLEQNDSQDVRFNKNSQK